MEYRQATINDINEIFELQKTYHVDTIDEVDKKDGFVTTLFSKEQLERLITQENGISLVINENNKIVGYAMAGSWQYWSEWPLFQHMIKDLANVYYNGDKMNIDNSYQYGPICIEKDIRGQGVMEELFNFSLKSMSRKYPYMITFINQINPRSYKAHVDKVGMDVIKTFKFNNNDYWELAIKTK